MPHKGGTVLTESVCRITISLLKDSDLQSLSNSNRSVNVGRRVDLRQIFGQIISSNLRQKGDI